MPIPGVTVEEAGTFALKASGGAAFAGGVAFYVTDGFGFEVRYDHADLTVETPGLDLHRAGRAAGAARPDCGRPRPDERDRRPEGGRALLPEPQAPHLGRCEVHRLRRREPPRGPRVPGAADDRPRRDRVRPRPEQHQGRDDRGQGDRRRGDRRQLGRQPRPGPADPDRRARRARARGARLLLPEAHVDVGAGPRSAAHCDRAGSPRPGAGASSRRSSSSRGGCRPPWASRSASDAGRARPTGRDRHERAEIAAGVPPGDGGGRGHRGDGGGDGAEAGRSHFTILSCHRSPPGPGLRPRRRRAPDPREERARRVGERGRSRGDDRGRRPPGRARGERRPPPPGAPALERRRAAGPAHPGRPLGARLRRSRVARGRAGAADAVVLPDPRRPGDTRLRRAHGRLGPRPLAGGRRGRESLARRPLRRPRRRAEGPDPRGGDRGRPRGPRRRVGLRCGQSLLRSPARSTAAAAFPRLRGQQLVQRLRPHRRRPRSRDDRRPRRPFAGRRQPAVRGDRLRLAVLDRPPRRRGRPLARAESPLPPDGERVGRDPGEGRAPGHLGAPPRHRGPRPRLLDPPRLALQGRLPRRRPRPERAGGRSRSSARTSRASPASGGTTS